MFVKLLAILAPIAAVASTTLPDGPLAVLQSKPVYRAEVDNAAFSVHTKVAVKTPPTTEGGLGKADFRISVKVTTRKEGKPYSFKVKKECKKADFKLEDSILYFNPTGSATTCTGEFVTEMNANFGQEVVSQVIPLSMVGGGAALIFQFGEAEIQLDRE
jgi:hypothetical protein